MLAIKKAEHHKRRMPKWGEGGWSHFDSKPRLYISIADEKLLENFAFRFDRPVAEYRKLLPEMFKKLGLPATTTARWSQKAGCSCGCSPGFILTGSGVRNTDFWVTLKASRAAQVTEITDRAISRAEQLAEQL